MIETVEGNKQDMERIKERLDIIRWQLVQAITEIDKTHDFINRLKEVSNGTRKERSKRRNDS